MAALPLLLFWGKGETSEVSENFGSLDDYHDLDLYRSQNVAAGQKVGQPSSDDAGANCPVHTAVPIARL